jgi:1,2-diacylglycerol 3-beta-galactosyltransferase
VFASSSCDKFLPQSHAKTCPGSTTSITAHPTWFNKGVDKCFVPSTVLKNAALQRQVQESQIVQYGLPIRRGFWRFGADYNQSSSSSSNDDAEQKPKPFWQFGKKTKKQPADDIQMEEKGMHHKPTIRDSLGLLDLPTVLIVGGGDGMGGIVNQATAVGERLQSLAAKRNDSSSNNNDPMYQMVVICGNNKSAQIALSPPQTNWGSNVAVNVKGFVNNMDEFMRSSDILVTKAGPGTIAEASICGLPCILSSFLPGQEEGNVPYVEENGFGCYKGTPEGIADTVEEWLSVSSVTTEGTILETMRECALNAARPDATLDIARDLADMVYTRKEELKRKGVEKKVNEVAVAA